MYSQEQISKLNILSKKYLEIVNIPDLTHKEIRRLQYLIKTHLKNDKVKLFGLINIYKSSKDLYLKIYCYKLLEKLEKDHL